MESLSGDDDDDSLVFLVHSLRCLKEVIHLAAFALIATNCQFEVMQRSVSIC